MLDVSEFAFELDLCDICGKRITKKTGNVGVYGILWQNIMTRKNAFNWSIHVCVDCYNALRLKVNELSKERFKQRKV